VDDLERIELSAVLDFFAATPPDVLRALDLAVLDLGDAAAFSIGAHPRMPGSRLSAHERAGHASRRSTKVA
jgi:hypothetical protein